METSTPAAADNFAKRLHFWRVSQNLTQAKAAQQLDIERSYLSQIERGRPPGNALRTRFLLLEKAASVKGLGQSGANFGSRNIPILSWAQAGQAHDFEQMPSDWNESVPSDVTDDRAFGVRLRGDSMEPRFSEGDIAVLLPSIAPTNGEVVVANIKDQGVLCKIMHVQLDKNLIKLSSYNLAYPPTEYHRDEFHWIFPVDRIIKQLRRK